ncbi:MAG: hypothetical protein KAU38_11890 [Desulfobacterales bacterium]|nr:hypothetical protein [Desulfobacterales bacterium]
MNEIEEYLHENPELIERFLHDNKPLLNEIKQTYADMLESSDLTGRFLLSKALLEIVRVTTETGKALMQVEMQARGINLTDVVGQC